MRKVIDAVKVKACGGWNRQSSSRRWRLGGDGGSRVTKERKQEIVASCLCYWFSFLVVVFFCISLLSFVSFRLSFSLCFNILHLARFIYLCYIGLGGEEIERAITSSSSFCSSSSLSSSSSSPSSISNSLSDLLAILLYSCGEGEREVGWNGDLEMTIKREGGRVNEREGRRRKHRRAGNRKHSGF